MSTDRLLAIVTTFAPALVCALFSLYHIASMGDIRFFLDGNNAVPAIGSPGISGD